HCHSTPLIPSLYLSHTPSTTQTYTLSLHDALPISGAMRNATKTTFAPIFQQPMALGTRCHQLAMYVVFESPLQMLSDSPSNYLRSEEHTSELQSRVDLVCRLLLEKKKKTILTTAKDLNKLRSVGCLLISIILFHTISEGHHSVLRSDTLLRIALTRATLVTLLQPN